jgi:DDB1- and CUL4-associated factor 11
MENGGDDDEDEDEDEDDIEGVTDTQRLVNIVRSKSRGFNDSERYD